MATESTPRWQGNNYEWDCETSRRDFYAIATFFDEALEDRATAVPAVIRGYFDALGQDATLRVLTAWRTRHSDSFSLVSRSFGPGKGHLTRRETDRVYMASRIALTDLRCRVFDAQDAQSMHQRARQTPVDA